MSGSNIFIDSAKVEAALAGQDIPDAGVELSLEDKWKQAVEGLIDEEPSFEEVLIDEEPLPLKELSDDEKWADVNPADMLDPEIDVDRDLEEEGEEAFTQNTAEENAITIRGGKLAMVSNGRVIVQEVSEVNRDGQIKNLDPLTASLDSLRQKTA